MRRYRRRHRFIIQAMKAKENDTDRRKIWNDASVENLDLVQCIRIFTLKANRQRSDKSISEDEFDELAIPSSSETGESETTSLQVQLTTDEEKSTKINELNKQINNKLGSSSLPYFLFYEKKTKKRKECENLLEAVNEVKKLEIDLDRATIQCNNLNKKIILDEDQQKIIKEKLAKMDAILDTLKIK
ncbi:hypothetical protein WUBG_07491 [Wuchereria bancrofti]|uniref:Uncharacterized protein n=1 Tax=Wuchereria bancrofti TaxID=6293 RepID=J9EHJ0_WUCBA|nr:hypothetical protein WUBG_07491 [Wuchereria bancrofti]